MLQMSVLRVFYELLSDQRARSNPALRPALQLAARVTRNLLARLLRSESEAGEVTSTAPVADSDAAESAPSLAAAEKQVRTSCQSLLFVELLFWKSAAVAEDVRNEYNWKKVLYPPAPAAAGRRRAALGEDDEEEAQQAGVLPPDLGDRVVELFETCNGEKDCLSRIQGALGGAVARSRVSRHLKLLGLARGRFTARQDERLRQSFADYSEQFRSEPVRERERSTIALVTERLGAGFTERQVRKRLRELGLLSGGARKEADAAAQGGARAGRSNWDSLLGDDDDDDDDDDGKEGDDASTEEEEEDSEDEAMAENALPSQSRAARDSSDRTRPSPPGRRAAQPEAPNASDQQDEHLSDHDDCSANLTASSVEREDRSQHSSPSSSPAPSQGGATHKRGREGILQPRNNLPDAQESEALSQKQRLAALELLRKRHRPNVEARARIEEEALVVTELAEAENGTSSAAAPRQSQSPAAKTFGRRLKKKTASTTVEQLALPADLED